ncbi:hypothetical protein BVI2075_80106 [Burkholderia vietnamiensis]|nr:hypothetical protein BVI1335_1060036 [Burkholderia vietnamiensis]CAG9222051.1 hypothetical protein BVI2075_80106 [Burkholderia vietnamiensis]
MLGLFRHPPDEANPWRRRAGRRVAAQEGLPWKPRTLFANRWTAPARRRSRSSSACGRTSGR